MTPIEIPVISLGSGSQPAEEDGATLEYLAMPKGMETDTPPVYPEPDQLSELTRGLGLLRELLDILNRLRAGGLPGSVDQHQFPAADRDMIVQALGEGDTVWQTDCATRSSATALVRGLRWISIDTHEFPYLRALSHPDRSLLGVIH